MNRLFEIASELGNNARASFELKQRLAEVEALQSARNISLIPDGGWPGSNDTQRKAAEKTTKANDPQLVEYAIIVHDLSYDLGKLEVDRDALIAERQAWEWTIRDRETIKPPEGLKTSVFADHETWQDEQYQAESAAVDDQGNATSFAGLDEFGRDNLVASIRTAEMNSLSAACMWELAPTQLPESAKAARIRNEELQELQDAYEAKYHL